MRLSRFIFLAIDRSDRSSARLRPDWRPVARAPESRGPDTPAYTFRWVLASPNNRELGRGSAFWPSYQACREDTQRLQAGIGEVESVLATDAAIGQWSWRIVLGDAVVAQSARLYQRERECRYSLNAFLTAVPTANLVDGVRRLESPNRGGYRRSPRTDSRPEPDPGAQPWDTAGMPL
ncbi:MAG TPA: hypothetical protein VFI00_03095 [Kribbella sp.]|nr:hypothetical protein [Kribbella sp.]